MRQSRSCAPGSVQLVGLPDSCLKPMCKEKKGPGHSCSSGVHRTLGLTTPGNMAAWLRIGLILSSLGLEKKNGDQWQDLWDLALLFYLVVLAWGVSVIERWETPLPPPLPNLSQVLVSKEIEKSICGPSQRVLNGKT